MKTANPKVGGVSSEARRMLFHLPSQLSSSTANQRAISENNAGRRRTASRLGAVLLVFALLTPTSLWAQGALANGGAQDGSIDAAGETDAWTFTANSGDNIILRVGATNINPKIELYAPGGALVKTAVTASPSIRDAVLSYRATNSGNFTAVISSYYAGGTSAYRLRLAVMPGGFIVPAGDEGGALVDGSRHAGVMELGDLDLWSFTANAGDSIELRAGATNFNPQIQLFGPDGVLIETAATASPANLDAWLRTRATNSGTFTVVVSSFYLNGTGAYQLHFAQAPGAVIISPGDEGGPLANGGNYDGAIDIGDLDVWTFAANSGDSVMLRVGATNFTPYLELYGPNGALLDTGVTASPANRDAVASVRLTNSGTFTVVVSSFYLNGAGTYRLHLAKAPGAFSVPSGDDGGTLVNGSRFAGVMELGDLDLWSFDAAVGDSFVVRVGTTNFTPRFDIYGPNGVLVGTAATASPANIDARFAARATNSGTYLVVVSSFYLGGAGAYQIHLAKAPAAIAISPGDEGGALANGGNHDGIIDAGDLDVWSFSGNAGDSVMLRAGATNLVPRVELYGPDGRLVDTGATASPANRDAYINVRLTNSGIFTVVVDSFYLGTTATGNGTYRLYFAQAPGAFIVPPGDEGGELTNGGNHDGIMDLGDVDSWSFAGNAGDSVVLRAGTTDFTPWLQLYGPDGRLVDTGATASPANRDALVSVRLTNSGTFTVVLNSFYLGGAGAYRLYFAQSPGAFSVPSGDEGGALTNGGQYAGTLDLGDLEVWSFTGNAGDSVVFRVGTTNFTPRLNLYGPDGVRTGSAVLASPANRDINLTVRLTNSGTFHLVVDSFYLGGTGTHQLHFAQTSPGLVVPPGDEGGTLTNGVPFAGTINSRRTRCLEFLCVQRREQRGAIHRHWLHAASQVVRAGWRADTHWQQHVKQLHVRRHQ